MKRNKLETFETFERINEKPYEKKDLENAFTYQQKRWEGEGKIDTKKDFCMAGTMTNDQYIDASFMWEDKDWKNLTPFLEKIPTMDISCWRECRKKNSKKACGVVIKDYIIPSGRLVEVDVGLKKEIPINHILAMFFGTSVL